MAGGSQYDTITGEPKRAPLVSVVIPTYNRAAFVVKAVESVLNQTFTDYELIVVDDGSTDSTRALLNEYRDKITYIGRRNSGVSAARNAGVAVASGQWLAFLDSDDEWKPEYLQTHVGRLGKTADLCMQATDCVITYSDKGTPRTYFELNGAMSSFGRNDYVLVEEPFAFVVSHQPWQVGSMIFRRDAAIKAGLFDPSLALHEDIDFVARMSFYGCLGLIKKNLVDIYRRDEQTARLTNQVKSAPLEARKLSEALYQKLKLQHGLRGKEHKALNRAMSANRRAMGNLMFDNGNVKVCEGVL